MSTSNFSSLAINKINLQMYKFSYKLNKSLANANLFKKISFLIIKIIIYIFYKAIIFSPSLTTPKEIVPSVP